MSHKNALFDDYEAFVDKFKSKKTTDDCYTPGWLYDLVVDYVNTEVRNLDGLSIERPFWPGGDFKAYEYKSNSVVIDNPPFSIFASIVDFYRRRGIPFFLFAPALTLGGVAKDYFTAVVCAASVTYENGAQVRTSFVSNMYEGNPAIIVAGDLLKRIEREQKKQRKETTVQLPVYDYPDGVVNAARLQKIANQGIMLRIEREEAQFIRVLESQRRAGKAIFGGGWLLGPEAAAREAAAREAAAREAAACEAKFWPLSIQEREAMQLLRKKDSPNKTDIL